MPNIKPISDLRNYTAVISEVAYGAACCTVYKVGNLKPKQLVEILKKATVDGYYDFTELKYQSPYADT